MKVKLVISMMIISLVFVVSGNIYAEVKGSNTTKDSTASSTTVEKQLVGNKICPVSGDKIKPEEQAQYEYNGKVYNFCCKMCLKDFKKNPEKYSRIAEDEVKNSAAKAK